MGCEYPKTQPILYYYVFQKKIKNYLNCKINHKKKKEIKDGYLINPNWINEWKSRINYDKIVSEYLDHFGIESTKLNEDQITLINENIENNFNEINLDENTSLIIKNNEFSYIERILSEKYLEIFVNKKTFNFLKINKKNTFIEIKYLFKEKMLILFYEKYNIIKVLIYKLEINNKNYKLINLTFNCNNTNNYKNINDFFDSNDSDKIIEFLENNKIFNKEKVTINNINNSYTIKNENFEKNFDKSFNNKFQQIPYHKGDDPVDIETLDDEFNSDEIKKPDEINYFSINRICYRGLDNVGATCYMNATLQCLANIKQITNYLLNKNNYKIFYKNYEKCKLTLKYIQVLIGLFCNESISGSYCPEDFKKTISELNPLFQGVKANDSKDLIIFLLELMNNELVKIYIIKHSINININETYKKIDPSNEKMVLDNFLKDFRKNNCSIIGDYLYGFNKSVFICQNCGGKAINFNIFNFLNFTSDYFNLTNNNSVIPLINFDHCFKFLSKEEIFQNTYCQKCGKTGLSKYFENVYSMPNYLIIILNRGKGNIFNCQVQIPEIFDASYYIEIKSEDNNYELVGIVSHFGESGMGGHFIAFCKHNIDGKWRCYNDSIVSECQNDYLQKGTPYILFYKKFTIDNDNFKQNIKETNNNGFNISQINFNNEGNYNNDFQNIFYSQMNINNINNNIPQNIFMSYNNQQNMLNNNDFNNYQQNMNNNIQNMMMNSNQQNMFINNNIQQNVNNINLNQSMNNNNFQFNMNNNFPLNMGNNMQPNINFNST